MAKMNVLSGSKIAAVIPTSIDEVFRLAEGLSKSSEMIPESYRKVKGADRPIEETQAMICAAILRGLEVGLAPLQALSSIAVINGRATLWGDALRALVIQAGHWIDCEVTGSGMDAIATATLTRSNGSKLVRTFSMTDAKRANLIGKAGPWMQYAPRMLMNRATAFAVRDGAADVLMGLGVAEEAEDYGPDYARDVTPRERAVPRRGGFATAAPLLPAATAKDGHKDSGESDMDAAPDGDGPPEDDDRGADDDGEQEGDNRDNRDDRGADDEFLEALK
jgi:hypothetical protein